MRGLGAGRSVPGEEIDRSVGLEITMDVGGKLDTSKDIIVISCKKSTTCSGLFRDLSELELVCLNCREADQNMGL